MNISKKNQGFIAAVGIKMSPAKRDGTSGASIGFVRVRKRKLKGAQRDRYGQPIVSSATFEIVRTVRVDGRPTHEFVLGLGSQKAVDPDCPCRFWIEALHRMIRYGLTEPQRCRVMEEMERKGARFFPSCNQRQVAGWESSYAQESEELKRFIARAWSRFLYGSRPDRSAQSSPRRRR